jgi:hypothetical protein
MALDLVRKSFNEKKCLFYREISFANIGSSLVATLFGLDQGGLQTVTGALQIKQI